MTEQHPAPIAAAAPEASPAAAMSRRLLLGGAGALGALTAAGQLVEEPALAATSSGRLPGHVDAVVVGGGLSGLVAARHIREKGRSVLVVEARDRVGGRLLNHELRNGSVVESGGAFIGPTQNHIKRLAKELGVDTFKEYVKGNNIYVKQTPAGGTAIPYTGTIPPDPTVLPDAGKLQEQIDQMASEIDVNAPWKHPKAEEWDSMSFDTWVRQQTVNPQVRDLILCYTQAAFGADGADFSLLFLVWYIACSGDEHHVGTFERSSGTPDAAQDSRFVGGSQLVPLRLAKHLGKRVALNAAVRRIRQSGNGVDVHTDRGTVHAKRVIVACPPRFVLDIDWSPLLPPRRAQLLQRMPMGALMKCDAVYKTPFWRKAGLSGSGLNTKGAVRTSFDNSPPDGSVGVLLSFVGGSTWNTFGNMSKTKRRQAVLEGFAAIVGEKALHPIQYVEHDWTHERWTQGSPVAIQVPGAIYHYGREIREPFGRVHWAGTETSTYWAGYMDGAVRAGERAAREVLAAL